MKRRTLKHLTNYTQQRKYDEIMPTKSLNIYTKFIFTFFSYDSVHGNGKYHRRSFISTVSLTFSLLFPFAYTHAYAQIYMKIYT